MSTRTETLDRFLRAVRRRWMVVRALESAGACVLGGSAVALVLLPVLLWRGEPALPVVLVIMAIAAAAGLIAGVVRRPDLMSAAGEADRQFELSDLLSTALATRAHVPADPWANMVLVTADARCRGLSANGVILNRFGARAWGGIGLAGALVLTLALMSAHPRSSVAIVASGSSELSEHPAPSRRAADRAPQRGAAQPDRALANADAARDAASSAEDEPASSSNQGNAARQADSTSSAGGAGMATSRTPTSPSQRIPAPAQPRDSGSGEGAGGGGERSVSPSDRRDGAQGSSTVIASDAASAAPPWQTPAWPAARDEALSAVRDGRVPEEYRDLVRTYFADPAE